ncbi:hypothetical protein M9H77_23999 [Catharanthus roseus]|uniref:Uncharacterized protein n=1 Tax=Catharanthus roseus TaxID=4058 RepID=A0ACC0AVA5_CATRO|nr:hypothetical protein M9H77_23999 [Catharanthus roseus]
MQDYPFGECLPIYRGEDGDKEMDDYLPAELFREDSGPACNWLFVLVSLEESAELVKPWESVHNPNINGAPATRDGKVKVDIACLMAPGCLQRAIVGDHSPVKTNITKIIIILEGRTRGSSWRQP